MLKVELVSSKKYVIIKKKSGKASDRKCFGAAKEKREKAMKKEALKAAKDAYI